MDWWQTHTTSDLTVTALPSQHWSYRSVFDTNQSLWASWSFQWPSFSSWFGGDTGYNSVQFKEIGEYLSKVDLAMIPISTYDLRWFMKYHHTNPADAIEIFKEINAEYAFGGHWNTFVLTAEPINEPPQALSAAMKAN